MHISPTNSNFNFSYKVSCLASVTLMASNENWELLGSKNWEGLLNPLDDSLCHFILRCGDLADSANDALNADPTHP